MNIWRWLLSKYGARWFIGNPKQNFGGDILSFKAKTFNYTGWQEITRRDVLAHSSVNNHIIRSSNRQSIYPRLTKNYKFPQRPAFAFLQKQILWWKVQQRAATHLLIFWPFLSESFFHWFQTSSLRENYSLQDTHSGINFS